MSGLQVHVEHALNRVFVMMLSKCLTWNEHVDKSNTEEPCDKCEKNKIDNKIDILMKGVSFLS